MIFLKCPRSPPLPHSHSLYFVRLIIHAGRGRISFLEYPVLMELYSLLQSLAMGSHSHSFPQHTAVCFPGVRVCPTPLSFATVTSKRGCFLLRSQHFPFIEFSFLVRIKQSGIVGRARTENLGFYPKDD